MKKVLFFQILAFCLFSSNECPEFTREMMELGLRRFPIRAEQIVSIYLCEDDVFDRKVEDAHQQFQTIEMLKKERGEKKSLIPLYWELSRNFDFGPANDILAKIFRRGLFEMEKNREWSLFFGNFAERPNSVRSMNLWRIAYQEQEEHYRSILQSYQNKDDERKDCVATDDKDLQPQKFSFWDYIGWTTAKPQRKVKAH
ncbi:MAG: hypothetical protein CNLJKLNK_00860 [Holosporales bacterium]